MTAKLYVPSADLGAATVILHQRESGPLSEVYLGPVRAPWMELTSVADFDALIGVLRAGRLAHAGAQERWEASQPEPLPERPARTTGPLSGDDLPLTMDEPAARQASAAGKHAAGGNPYPPPVEFVPATSEDGSYGPEFLGALRGEQPPDPEPPLEPLPRQDEALDEFLAATDLSAAMDDRDFADAWGKPDRGEVVPPAPDATAVMPAVAEGDEHHA